MVIGAASCDDVSGGWSVFRVRSSPPWSLIWTPPGWQVTRSIE